MNRIKPMFGAILLAGTAMGLAACSDGATDSGPAEQTTALPLEISDARLILPAVAGNPGAAYFKLTNTGDTNLAIRGAEVEGAESAEIHGTMEMAGKMEMSMAPPQLAEAGATLTFEPGGTHVMAFNLSPDLKAGGTTKLTLIVAGGDKASFDIPIKAAGDDR